MKIALISLNQAWENKKENQSRIMYQLECLKQAKPDLVVLPELSLTGFTMNTTLKENPDSSETISFFSSLAQQYNTGIVFGTMLSNGAGLARNTLQCIDSTGKLLKSYDKIHPFTFADEDTYYAPGKRVAVIHFKETTIGFAICYDLRFPELYQAMSATAEIIITIANWPSKRLLHWQTLLQARAIENQAFMIGVNRTGEDGNRLFYEKSSTIFDPQGNICPSIPYSSITDVYSIDPTFAREWRTLFPAKKDRRIDIYKEIL